MNTVTLLKAVFFFFSFLMDSAHFLFVYLFDYFELQIFILFYTDEKKKKKTKINLISKYATEK